MYDALIGFCELIQQSMWLVVSDVGFSCQGRDAAVSTVPVEAIEPFNPNRWAATKTASNTSSFPT